MPGSISSFVTDFCDGHGDPDFVPDVSSFGRLAIDGSSGVEPFSSNAPPNYNLLLTLF